MGRCCPFTLLLVPIILYWLMAAIGALDLEFLNVDFDAHVDTDNDVDVDAGDFDGGGHGPFLGFVHGALKIVNGTDVPIMAVFSFLFIFLWICAMLGNLWFNPDGTEFRGTMIGLGSFVGAVLLTRLATEPLKPIFRAMKGADYAKPQTLAKDTVSQLQTIIEGLRAVPVKVDINIVPVQDQGDGPIESIEKTSKKKAAKKKQVKKPMIDIEPEVSQGD
ncbi:MAG: hypothetical protein ABGZ49_08975 [Akkermansiaceae bacterium]